MAYSQISDLVKHLEEDDLVQLASRNAEAGILDEDVEAVLNEKIESADGEIDDLLLGRWPSLRSYDPVPPTINRISAQNAIYYLFLRSTVVPEDWEKQYNRNIKKMEDAAEGKFTLGLDTSGDQADEAENFHRTDALDTDDDLDSDDPRTNRDKLDKLFG